MTKKSESPKKSAKKKKDDAIVPELHERPKSTAPSAGEIRLARLPLLQCLGMAHQRNPKEHDIEALVASFKRFGFVAPPTIDEASGVMVAGHGRCEALEAMYKLAPSSPPSGIELSERGEWLVPVIRGIAFASDSERDAYVIADNQHVINGGWKFDLLTEMLGELRDAGGFDGLGFEAVELDNLLGNYVDDSSRADGFDPEDLPPPADPDGGGNKPRTQITARIECPNCGHMIDR